MLHTAWAPTFNLRLISRQGAKGCWNNPLSDFTKLCATKAPGCSTHDLHTFDSVDITGHELVQFLLIHPCREACLCFFFLMSENIASGVSNTQDRKRPKIDWTSEVSPRNTLHMFNMFKWVDESHVHMFCICAYPAIHNLCYVDFICKYHWKYDI